MSQAGCPQHIAGEDRSGNHVIFDNEKSRGTINRSDLSAMLHYLYHTHTHSCWALTQTCYTTSDCQCDEHTQLSLDVPASMCFCNVWNNAWCDRRCSGCLPNHSLIWDLFSLSDMCQRHWASNYTKRPPNSVVVENKTRRIKTECTVSSIRGLRERWGHSGEQWEVFVWID